MGGARRGAVLGALIGLWPALAPAPAAAQDLPPAALAGLEQTVRACFDDAAPGETAPDCLGAAAGPCTETPQGQTTLGTAQCIMAETTVWDDLLNTHYKALRAEMLAQGNGLNDRLLEAQRAWIAFRDAECALDHAIWADGTIRQIVAANCDLQMTAARALQLRDKGTME